VALTWTLKRGDTLDPVEITAKRGDNSLEDLNDVSVKFIMVEAVSSLQKVNSDGFVSDVAGARIRYDWDPNDTNTAGTFNAEFQVTYPNGHSLYPTGGVKTYPNGNEYIVVHIYPDLGD
jgi:hypothetical protein